MQVRARERRAPAGADPGRRPRLGEPSGLAALAFVGAALIAVRLLAGGPASTVAEDVLPPLAVAAVAAGIRIHRPARPLVWRMIGLSIPLFAAPGYLYQLIPEPLVRSPAVGDLAALLPIGGFAALLLGTVLAGRSMHPRANWPGIVEQGLLGVAGGTAIWELVLMPLDHAIPMPGPERFLTASIPALGLMVMAALLRLVLETPEGIWSLGALEAATATSMVAFLWLAIAEARAGPAALAARLPVLVGAWMATGVLTALAALHPSMRRLAEPGPRRPEVLGRWRTLSLGLALLAPASTTVAMVRVLGQPFLARTLIISSVAVTVLVLARLHQLFLARERVQTELVLGERRFRRLVENQSDHVLVVRGTAVSYQSPSVTRLLGFEADGLVRGSIRALLPEAEVPLFQDLAAQSRARGGAPAAGMLRGRTAAGEERIFEAAATDLTSDPAVGGVVVVLRDATDRARFEAELRRRALHDPLTGLANRTLVLDRARQLLAAARRSRKPVAALFVDLDNFKVINDSLGHSAGDELLRAVGDRLQRAVREADTVGRLGGDEFVILIAGEDAGLAPERVAERVRDVLRPPFEVAGRPHALQASVGVAVRDGGSADDLLREADISMYRAKSHGKDRVVVFQPQMERMARARLELETDLRAALAAEVEGDGEQGLGPAAELALAYQPAVDLRTLQVTGLEALIRWTHPRRGPIPPAAFIPLAEEIGVIGDLGRWVLRQACRAAAGWQDRSPGLAVSVNVSGQQLDSGALLGDVRDALQASGLPPGCLVLEITETALMREPGVAARSVRALKALGVRVAIDDFGTGYSSLSYLRQFPVDVLKIDRSFIREVQDSGEAVAVVQTLVQLGKALDLEVVAEGVEIEDQLSALQRQRCDMAQGYLFARPIAAEHVQRFLEAWALGGAGRPRPPADRAG
jgi:diguanylate cyclase (GGDEF)-like protein/PAS domain S-box-containing protein